MLAKSISHINHFSTKAPKMNQKLSSIYGAGLSASGALAIPSLVVNTKIVSYLQKNSTIENLENNWLEVKYQDFLLGSSQIYQKPASNFWIELLRYHPR